MSIPQHLQDKELSEGQRQQLWEAIQHQRKRRRWLQRGVAASAVVAVAALAVLLVVDRAPTPRRAVVATEQRPTKLTLPDGSRVMSQPGAELEVTEGHANGVRVDLQSGVADFLVQPNTERPFVVVVPSVELRVVGTRFRVTVETSERQTRTVLDVREGLVEVRTRQTGELLSQVGAGGRWSSEESSSLERASRELQDAAAPPDTPSAAVPVPAPHAPEIEAAKMFDEATRARRDGQYQKAIRGYEALLKRYPKDRHAALAALELGRLKRTRTEDAEGAAEALEQAAKDEQLSDDALAHLVLTYDQAGDWARCAAAKRRYLERHPDGVHATEVRARCTPEPESKPE